MRILVFLFFFLCCISAIFAQTSKLKELEEQRKRALLDIENTNKLLKDTKTNTSSLLERIKLISSQIETRQRIVNLLEQEIEEIGVEENKINGEIHIIQGELKIKKDAYQKAIVSMMRNRQSDNKLLFILSGRSLTESYRRFMYLKDYSEWRKRQAEHIGQRNLQLEAKHDSLTLAKKEKELLLTTKADEQQKLKDEESIFQTEVVKIQQSQKDLQRVLEQKKRQAQALDKQIEKLIAEEVARQEKKAKREKEEEIKKPATASSGEKPKVETTTEDKPSLPTIISTKENIQLSNNFSSNRGKLPYPITGNYTITSRFGPQKHGKWVTTSSGGLDIQSQGNAQARAVFNGEITYISSFPGYGTCIIIRHGNYYTFYGNIKDITVKKGERVDTGQTLGTVYTDPDTNVSQMHFQLWRSKTKLDPEPWLRR